MAKKERFYVVWQGVTPGIYNSWAECKAQVHMFDKALYKSFNTREEAELAFRENPWKHLSRNESNPTGRKGVAARKTHDKRVIRNSIAVDAACSGNPGRMEYRGVYMDDGKEIFHHGPLEGGTNNIGEFLAIVHALALLKKKGSKMPIYSDSANAIKWIERKKCNTKLERTTLNEPVFDLIERAEKWLHQNSFANAIIKWDTTSLGEIPADFGRK